MAERDRRRTFLKASLAAAVAGLRPLRGEDGPAPAGKTTLVYKKIGGLELQADVYGDAAGASRPVALWLHGGALIMGNRAGIDPALRDVLVKAGYVVISADYRLAPETKLPAILDDVRDLCRWVRAEGPKRFHAAPDKLAVLGGSAGGYLTLTTGYRASPRPQALVSFWGYGDITGPWYSKPDPFYRKQPLVTEDEARRAVGTEPLASSPAKSERSKFYLYCRQNGLWPREVAGLDPAQDPKAFDPYCPVRNASDQFPPTLLVHGTNDTDVPYHLSESMAAELFKHGVESELLTIPDAGHGLSGARPGLLGQVYERVVAFLDAHLK